MVTILCKGTRYTDSKAYAVTYGPILKCIIQAKFKTVLLSILVGRAICLCCETSVTSSQKNGALKFTIYLGPLMASNGFERDKVLGSDVEGKWYYSTQQLFS